MYLCTFHGGINLAVIGTPTKVKLMRNASLTTKLKCELTPYASSIIMQSIANILSMNAHLRVVPIYSLPGMK